MLTFEVLPLNGLKIRLPSKLQVADLIEAKVALEALLAAHGNVRVMIDATAFGGWGNVAALEVYVRLVKDHQSASTDWLWSPRMIGRFGW